MQTKQRIMHKLQAGGEGAGAHRIWAARFSMLRALPEPRSALMPVCELL